MTGQITIVIRSIRLRDAFEGGRDPGNLLSLKDYEGNVGTVTPRQQDEFEEGEARNLPSFRVYERKIRTVTPRTSLRSVR